jgi:hypothetical protein
MLTLSCPKSGPVFADCSICEDLECQANVQNFSHSVLEGKGAVGQSVSRDTADIVFFPAEAVDRIFATPACKE